MSGEGLKGMGMPSDEQVVTSLKQQVYASRLNALDPAERAAQVAAVEGRVPVVVVPDVTAVAGVAQAVQLGMQTRW